MADSDSLKPQSPLERADGLIETGHHGEAAELYLELCRNHPENVTAWTGLAIALLRQQRFWNVSRRPRAHWPWIHPNRAPI